MTFLLFVLLPLLYIDSWSISQLQKWDSVFVYRRPVGVRTWEYHNKGTIIRVVDSAGEEVNATCAWFTHVIWFHSQDLRPELQVDS